MFNRVDSWHSTFNTDPNAPFPSSWTCLNKSHVVSIILTFSETSSIWFISLMSYYLLLIFPFYSSSFFLLLIASFSDNLFLTKCKLPVLFRCLTKFLGLLWSTTLVIWSSSWPSSLDISLSSRSLLPSDLSVGFRLRPLMTETEPLGWRLWRAEPSFELGLADILALTPA